jgi:hypothetical protein
VDGIDRRVVADVGVALWSAMTAACGLAGSFSHTGGAVALLTMASPSYRRAMAAQNG